MRSLLEMTLVPLLAVFTLAVPRASRAADPVLRAVARACEDEGRATLDRPRLVLVVATTPAERRVAVDRLAGELGARVERLDVGALVSGYIGETEKNLARVFAAPEPQGAVLFFDEADALFGARSEPQSAPQRTAMLDRLKSAKPARLILLGLRERPVVGSLVGRSLASLPGLTSPPWAALCGPPQ